MDEVNDLRKRRIEKLAANLADQLQHSRGHIQVRIEDLDVPLDEWRAAGRRAGRILGWKIRTFVSNEVVFLIDNRTRDDLSLPERVEQERRMREAVESITFGLDEP